MSHFLFGTLLLYFGEMAAGNVNEHTNADERSGLWCRSGWEVVVDDFPFPTT